MMTWRKSLNLTVLGLLWIAFLMPFLGGAGQYDLIVRGATIVDGTGRSAFKGDIAIKDEKIAAVGKIKGEAALVIDGSGLIACPGFIDTHTHADQGILSFPLAENLIMQGITTVLAGNCGISAAPIEKMSFGDWMAKVEHSGTSLNIAMLVGHSMIRGAVMGNDWRRKASGAEIEKMKALVEEAMRSGAFGISAGVDQPWPGLFASTEELVELAKVAQKYGGIYSPHTRGIRSGWFTDDPEKVAYAFFLGPPEDIWVGRFRGYLEAIEVARQARIPLLIAHFSDAYKIPQPHPAELERATAKATLSEIIDKARAEGINVTYNVIATEAGISGHLPMIEAFYDNAATPALNWIKEFSREEFVERLKTREFRARIRRAEESCSLKFGMIHTKEDPYWMNCFKITASQNKEYEEKTIGQIAGVKKTDALETIFDLLVEDPKITWVQFLDRRSTEATLEVFLKHPAASPCTDMDVLPADPDSASDSLLSFYGLAPIAFGMFADYFGTLVRDRGILTIEEAVKKATSFPAQILGIKDRGYLAADAYADVVLFDLRTIRMTGDFKKPAQRPEGIKFVLVNGKVVYRDKAHTGEKPGKVLRHKF